MSRAPLSAVDLFAGAGGISLGLERAGYRVLLANDVNPVCAQTYRLNFPTTSMVEGSVAALTGPAVFRATGLAPGELDLLIGGPPCQGFSILGMRETADPRNALPHHFFRLARALRPRCIVIENVPGLATLDRGAPLEWILGSLRALGYVVNFAELLAAQYGVPQMRWRLVFIAFRGDLGIEPGMGFPKPTHGRRGIGELVSNCTIAPADLAGFLTARDAISDLPPIHAGELGTVYTGRPMTAYQQAMREDAPTTLSNHYAPRLSSQNLARIEALEPGQDWRDLPRRLLPPGMRRAKKKDHTRRYSRMTWQGVPRAIITRFRDPKSGEYIHPEQTRTISIREAARIQGFPDAFVFTGAYSDQYDQVGNAVPPTLAEALGREIAACLSGEATYRLRDAFARRPSIQQMSLRFEALQAQTLAATREGHGSVAPAY